MERRCLLATFFVTSTDDAGPGTLRQAILDANAASGADRIEFTLPGPGPHSIRPLSALPDITDPVAIDGSTQAGFAGTPIVELDGSVAAGGTSLRVDGLRILAGSSEVVGLAINRFPGDGIEIAGSLGSRLAGNYIGTDVTGAMDLGNGLNGIRVVNSRGNAIGGPAAGEGNLVSGNNAAGILLDASTGGLPAANVLRGNRVGTDASGTAPLGNSGDGVAIFTAGNQVGGAVAAEANTIAFNGFAGVRVGFFSFDTTPVGNGLRRNAIFENAGLGIDLGGDGVTFNDPGDSDSGPNRRQNFPDLTSAYASAGGTTIEGAFNSTPGAGFALEFFSSEAPDPTGFGEGRVFLGSSTLTTGADGEATFTIELPSAVAPGQVVTATATDAAGNTSEFSRAILATSAPQADLGLALDDSPDTARVGETLTYTLTVTNDGPSRATGVSATTTLPEGVEFVSASSSQGTTSQAGGVVTAAVGTLLSGEAATVRIDVRPTAAGPITARASVGSDVADPDDRDNVAEVVTAVQPAIPADLVVQKFAEPASVVLGEELTYTVVLANQGPNPNASGVVLTDILPEGVEFVSATASQGTVVRDGRTLTASIGDLPSGANAALRIVVRPTVAGPIVNEATARGDQADPDALNNSVRLTTEVLPEVGADLSVAIFDVPDPVRIGQDLVYTVVATNSGPGIAEGVTIVDQLPAGVTIISASIGQGSILQQQDGIVAAEVGRLLAGQSVPLTIVVRPTVAGTIANTATVDATTIDFNPLNDRSTQETTVLSVAPADLGVAVIDVPDPVRVGETLVYTIFVSNAGPGDAAGASLAIDLPDGAEFVSATSTQGTVTPVGRQVVADLGSLGVNGLALLTIVVRPLVPGGLTLTATAQGLGPDFNPLNNRAAEVTAALADDLPPVVIEQRLLIARGTIAGIVLTFSEPMDPALAGDVRNYRLGNLGRGRNGASDGAASGSVVPLDSATYDPIAQTVTLRPRRGLSIGSFYELTANGVGATGLTDLDGNVLDGDLNGLPEGIYESLVGRGTHTRPLAQQRGPRAGARPIRPRFSGARQAIPLASPTAEPAPRPTLGLLQQILRRRGAAS